MTSDLTRLLNPRSVAVIGAGLEPGKVRGRFLHNLKISGYRGAIYPVNPKHAEVQGFKAYPNLAALPEPVDLAMIAIPSEGVCEALIECGRAQTRAAVVYSGVPSGAAGSVMQAEMAKIARDHHIRLLGPNCLGFFSPANQLAATFTPLDPEHFKNVPATGKRIAIVSQSGGTALRIFQMCHIEGLRVVLSVMPGNEADLEVVELLEYVLDSAEADIVLMYVEGFRDGRRFMEVAAKAAAKAIPIVMMKAGRTKAGTRSAISHTAHLTGSDTSYEAIFHRYGIIRVWDPEEMIAVVCLLARHGVMKGPNVAIVSTQGGFCSLAADLCEANGLRVPVLDQALQADLTEFVPDYGSTQNPVDTGTTMDDRGKNFCKVIQLVERSDDIHAIYAVLHLGQPGVVGDLKPNLEALAGAATKPVIFYSVTTPAPGNLPDLKSLGFNYLPPRAAVQSMRALTDYGEFLGRWQAFVPTRSTESRIRPGQESFVGQGVLSRDQHAALFARYEVPFPAEQLVVSEDEACRAGNALGYPVAAKIESPDIPHKTEAGGVELGLRDDASLRQAFRDISSRARSYAPDARIDGVLVQKMARPGREIIVGMLTDPDFGPLLMVGFGGVFAEVLKDVVFAPLPVNDAAATDMIQRLKGIEILRGVRGQPPADIQALAKLLVNVSCLVEDNPGIGQLDLNPVFVYAQGDGLCVVDSLLVPCETHPLMAVTHEK